MATGERPVRWTRVIRWVARVIATVAALFWLLVGIAHAVVDPEPLVWESWVIAALIVSACIAVGVAWWREGLGGLLILAVGIAHSTFALIVSGHNHVLAIAMMGGPFPLSGALFLLSRRRSRRGRRGLGSLQRR